MGNTHRNRRIAGFLGVAILGTISALDAAPLSESPAAEPFTIVAIPDSQHLVDDYPHIFTAQTQWIRDNVDALNIVFVTHEGDVVQDADKAKEWERAKKSMSYLDGVVPYGIAPGNHDQDIHRGSTLYEDYFTAEEYEDEEWYGGSYPPGTNWNSFQLFSAGGNDFLALHLEFCPSDDTVAWADAVLKAHPERKALLTTHAFLNHDGTFSARHCPEVGVTGSTDAIWEDLVVTNDNVHMVLCGHDYPDDLDTPGEVRQTHVVNEGTGTEREVHVLLANYQNIDKKHSDGRGFLRILQFDPATDTIAVSTYSPYLDAYRNGDESEFELTFPLQPAGGGFSGVPTPKFVRGDCNGDGSVGLSDAVFQLNFSFLGGDAPGCQAACDTNGDAAIDPIADAAYLLNHQFLGGEAPPAPFPACGADPAGDSGLGCATGADGCSSV